MRLFNQLFRLILSMKLVGNQSFKKYEFLSNLDVSQN